MLFITHLLLHAIAHWLNTSVINWGVHLQKLTHLRLEARLKDFRVKAHAVGHGLAKVVACPHHTVMAVPYFVA